jgi:hypothetical protein
LSAALEQAKARTRNLKVNSFRDIVRDQTKREQYWPEVEGFFGSLPPHLFRQGLLLKNALTVRCAETGQLKNMLRREQDYPLLSFHFWLLDDLGIPEGQARARLEKHLCLAAFFSFAAAFTRESLLDQDTFFDQRFVYLEQALVQHEVLHLAQLFPGTSPFWQYHRSFWGQYAEANLWELQLHTRRLAPMGREDLWRSAAKLAPAKLPVAAVALHSGRDALLPQLLSMVDHLNLIFQARRDILALRRDLFRGVYTYPVVRTMMAAGMPLQAPLVPEQVLGAALLTGSIQAICRESLEGLVVCREIARELCLPTWLAYFDTVEAITRELLGLFLWGAASDPSSGRCASAEARRTTFLPYNDSLARAIKAAEGYLLSDLTFRESWEVQRYVLGEEPEVTCKAFPSGFILELLCANGHCAAEQVDEVFRTLQRDDFRYYDKYDIPPDTDDLGLLLRLARYSGQEAAHREMLERPLRWLERDVLPTGEIPVYLTKGVDAPVVPANIWATRCISVDSNLLLGLIDYDWERYRALIERSALNLFGRLLHNGLGLTTNYDLLYALWVLSRLMAQLSARPISAALRDRMEPASAAMCKRLAQVAKRRFASPQDAALLTLACLDHASESLFRPHWITILLKNQRYDGSWEAEPFYPTANRGGVPTWYASRSMTTAFCYHALQTYCRQGQGSRNRADPGQ